MDANIDLPLRDFAFPALVALLAAYFSYRGAYKLNEDRQDEDTRIKTLDLIERMLLDIDKLLSVLETLKEDAEKLRFFSLANTRVARDIILKLRGHFYSITLFRSDKFRKQILESVDVAESLINEMDDIENHIVNERVKSNNKREELEKLFVDIKVRLLDQNFYIDIADNYRPKPIGARSKTNSRDRILDQKSEVIGGIINDLVNSLKTSQDTVTSLDAEYEKRRSFMVVKILDTQTKFRDLVGELDQRKLELQKQS